MAKTKAMKAPLLFLVEYSDITIADRGYMAPIPMPRKKRQNASEPTTAGPLVPNENADMKAMNAKIAHATSNRNFLPYTSARDPPTIFPTTAPHKRDDMMAAS
jgi:hypothetical protein